MPDTRFKCTRKHMGETVILIEGDAFDLDKRIWTIQELTVVNGGTKVIATGSSLLIGLVPIVVAGRYMITRLTRRNYWGTFTGTSLQLTI